jgi:hypothetical protein
MRKANWQELFWAAVERERLGPFVWGERDCVLVAARVCDSVLEEPRLELLAKSFTWSSAREALAVLDSQDNLLNAINSILGEPVKSTLVRQGDLVLCSYSDPDQLFDQTLAFHDGTTPITPGDRKLVSVNPSLMICGWRVG